MNGIGALSLTTADSRVRELLVALNHAEYVWERCEAFP
jgi:hypothetical protein